MGNLTTRIKDIRCRKVLEELVAQGHQKKYCMIISRILDSFVVLCGKTNERTYYCTGGEVRFFAKLTDIFHEMGMTAVEVNGTEKIENK